MKACSPVIHWFILLMLACNLGARDDGSLLKQIQDTIGRIRAAQTLDVRAAAADRLASITEKINPAAIDDKTFDDLVALMDSPDDVVRAWVAASLGNLGSRAKPAVPTLLRILGKVDCRDGAITSADAIRVALKRIGIMPPPRPDCGRIGA